jgi:SWI/SNF-related matrix-associated actin-dependent regulator of chromatin subfamily A3
LRGGNAKGLHNIRTVLDTLCLRRTRDILPLPEFIEEVIRLDLSKPEDELYSCLRYEARRILEDAINKSSTRGVFHGILQSILRLRILCNHGTLHQIVSPDTSPDRFSEHNETFNLLNQIGRAACASCGNPVDSLQKDEGSITGILKACSHIICQDCDEKLLKKPGSRKRNRDSEMCSLCAESLASESGPSTLEISIPSDAYLTPPRSVDGRTTSLGFSTKISALVETLRRTGLSGKSIVFSFWRKTLDLIEVELNANRLPSVRMDGTVSIRDRQRVISEFENTPVPILLMTTGTGSQGLSLPAANHVFVVEPQWNPAVENQAIGRVLRLGQTRRVTVTRYIMRNTIEEAVRDRQSKKLEIAELTWKKENPEEQTLKTLMDLRALF